MASGLLTEDFETQNFYTAYLTADATDTDTDIFLDIVPNGTEGTLIIEPDSDTNREIIFYNSKSSTKVTTPGNGRGYDGTNATAHLTGSKVIIAPIADWFNSLGTGAFLDSASIAADKINFGGSGVGIWWEEIGRTTLGVAGDTITVSSLPVRKYLLLQIRTTSTGTITQVLRFNGDSSNNYAWRRSVNGGADGTSTTTSSLEFGNGDTAPQSFLSVNILNIASAEKQVIGFNNLGSSGVGNAPNRVELFGKWVNTSNAISSISYVNTNTGDFAEGSEIIVLGHN